MTYTTQEIQRRYRIWAAIPVATDTDVVIRHHAWCDYVDARDGLEGGTSKTRLPVPHFRTRSLRPLNRILIQPEKALAAQ
jgi:hypothetical protein